MYLYVSASLAFEPFVDWTDDKSTNLSDYLYKLTVAPQISLGRSFMSRPTIRAFLTYGHWGSGFVGKVGGPDFATSNDGLTWGVQMSSTPGGIGCGEAGDLKGSPS
jgi:maltoporin